jgi:hypothetical protein
MSEYNKEPWSSNRSLVFFPDDIGGFDIRNCPLPEGTARRIVDCVNACAGMDDPAAEIAALRTQLADATRKLEEASKDAERWAEFMRNTKFSIWYWCGSGKSPNKPISNAEAIALIDQAIEQGKGGDE